MINVYGEEFIPTRQTRWSVGYDISVPEDTSLYPDSVVIIDTGIRFTEEDRIVEFTMTKGEPEAYNTKFFFAMIVPRSSMGFKYGLRFTNTVCIIDRDYRDNILLSCKVDKEVHFKKGDRIAQMIFLPFTPIMNEQIPVKERSGGVGSTGIQTTFEEETEWKKKD